MKKFINLKYFIFVLALLILIYGIYIGETEIVLAKAVRICLECCGIG